MALELNDGEVVTGDLTDAEEISAEVETQTANYIEVLVDNNNGGTPSGYDLKVEFYSTTADAYFTVIENTSITESNPQIANDIRAQKVRVTLNANNSDNYRLSVESFTEI